MESRFSLIHFPMFVATWATFFIAAIVSFIAQVKLNQPKAGLAFVKHCFPFESWSEKTAWIDVFMYFATKVTDKLYAPATLLATVFISAVVGRALASEFPEHVALQFGYLTVVICSVVVFVVGDLANYISHVLQHFIPSLWELHKVHHSATFLNPMTTARMHPLGNAFDGLFSATVTGIPVGAFGFLFNFSLPEVLILAANANLIGTVVVLDALRHSHFPISFGRLDCVLLSPHMHQVHHSVKKEHWDKNFGNKLSIWDRFFGTMVTPTQDEELHYGLGTAEDRDYEKLTGVYLGPIVKIWGLIAGRRSLGGGVLWRQSDALIPTLPNGIAAADRESNSTGLFSPASD
jgi:sterol desaturase/sphingolipid hydroxylase (fatty acid hydroxylase superfamily)